MPIQTLEKMYTPKQVADHMGYSLATIYRYIDSGLMPVVKIRSGMRIKESDIIRLINNNTERRGTQKRFWRAG